MTNRFYWASITWTLLHTFPTVLTDDFYNNNAQLILNQIKNICFSVPCPYCSGHAKTHIMKQQFFENKNNPTLHHLKKNIFKFHNLVNASTRKRQFDESIINLYDDLDFIAILKEWNTKFVIKGINVNLSMQKQKVNKARNEFIQFINKIHSNVHNKPTGKTTLPLNTITTSHQEKKINNSLIKKKKNDKTDILYKINFL